MFLLKKSPTELSVAPVAEMLQNELEYTSCIWAASLSQSLRLSWMMQRESIQMYDTPILLKTPIASENVFGRLSKHVPPMNESMFSSSR
jgi:hypothetical protein